MSGKFIVSTDKTTIDILKKSGLMCLSENDKSATFINNNAITFDKKGLKFAYTDVIMF